MRHVGIATGGVLALAATRLVYARSEVSDARRSATCTWREARSLGHVDEIPEGLVRALSRGRCVAMLGAGVSKPAGLPGFEGLLQRVASSEQIRLSLPESGSYDELDQLQFQLAEALGKERMCRIMQKMLFLDKPFPDAVQPILQAFLKLPFAAVVSWNWDNLLDSHYVPTSNNKLGFESVIQSQVAGSYNISRVPLLKMQGDLSAPDSVVLTEQDYAVRHQLLRDSGFLYRLYQSHTVLHIGMSLRAGGVGNQKRAGSLHYAILNDVTPERRSELKSWNIEAISYDSQATEWMGNQIILEELARRVRDTSVA